MTWIEDKISEIEHMAANAGHGALSFAEDKIHQSETSAHSMIGSTGKHAADFAHEIAASKVGQAGKWVWTTFGQDYVEDAKYLWNTHLFDFYRQEAGEFQHNFWGALKSLPANIVREDIKQAKGVAQFAADTLLHPHQAWGSVKHNVSAFVHSHEGQRLMFDLVTLIPIGKAAGIAGKVALPLMEKIGLKGVEKFGAKIAEKYGIKGLVSLGEKFSQKLERGLQKSAFGQHIVSSVSHLGERIAGLAVSAEEKVAHKALPLEQKAVRWMASVVGTRLKKKQIRKLAGKLGDTVGGKVLGMPMQFLGKFLLGEPGGKIAGWIADKVGGDYGKEHAAMFAKRLVNRLAHSPKVEVGWVKRLFSEGKKGIFKVASALSEAHERREKSHDLWEMTQGVGHSLTHPMPFHPAAHMPGNAVPKVAALGLAVSASTGSGATLAAQVLANLHIRLAGSHVSRVKDEAAAATEISGAASSQAVQRSHYDNAPGGQVDLDPRMLSGMLSLAQNYSFTVSEIAGGSHSKHSRHYAGIAFDVGAINGVPVSAHNPDYQAFMAQAKQLGATEVLGPGAAGHSSHVHVGWPRTAAVSTTAHEAAGPHKSTGHILAAAGKRVASPRNVESKVRFGDSLIGARPHLDLKDLNARYGQGSGAAGSVAGGMAASLQGLSRRLASSQGFLAQIAPFHSIREGFLAQNAPFHSIREAAKSAWDPHPDVATVQGALESVWGKKVTGKNNSFGQKAKPTQPGLMHKTHAPSPGKSTATTGGFLAQQAPFQQAAAAVSSEMALRLALRPQAPFQQVETAESAAGAAKYSGKLLPNIRPYGGEEATPSVSTALQRKGRGDHPDVNPAALRDDLRKQSSGFVPDSNVRARLGGHLGFDPGGARLHTGPAAASAARNLNAEAFTIGNDVFFGDGRFDPHSPKGLGLIAHELTHVGQQTGTTGDKTRFFTQEGGDAMEREAQQTSEHVLANAGSRKGLFVEDYVREYEGEHNLSQADQKRLDRISVLALDEAQRLLKNQGVRGNVNADSLDVQVEIDLGAMSDSEAAKVWAQTIVEAVHKPHTATGIHQLDALHQKIQKWDSFEHYEIGNQSTGGPGKGIFLDCFDRDFPAAQRNGPVAAWPAPWNTMSDVQKGVLQNGLTYGDIVALSGDFYESAQVLDDPSRHGIPDPKTNFEALNKAPLREILDLVPLIRQGAGTPAGQAATPATTEQLQAASGGRYLMLAKNNPIHFTNPAPGGAAYTGTNIQQWQGMHRQAIDAAMGGNANLAWAINAAADHFLTDAFSSGHARTPRIQLLNGAAANIQSKVLHDLDNNFGVAMANPRGDKWVAYGDDNYHDPNSSADSKNADNRRFVLEADASSKAEIAAAIAQGAAYPIPANFAAEQIVPHAVDLTHDRWTGRQDNPLIAMAGILARDDNSPPMTDYEQAVNNLTVSEGPGMVTGAADDTLIRDWVQRQGVPALSQQPVGEKIRMINRLMEGNVSDEDAAAIERLASSVLTNEEMESIRNDVTPQLPSVDRFKWGTAHRDRISAAVNRVPVPSAAAPVPPASGTPSVPSAPAGGGAQDPADGGALPGGIPNVQRQAIPGAGGDAGPQEHAAVVVGEAVVAGMPPAGHGPMETFSSPLRIQRKPAAANEHLRSAYFGGDSTLEQIYHGGASLRRGSGNKKSVMKVQQALSDLGFRLPESGVDGDYGKETEKTVQSYQTARSLDPDGKVGPDTLRALETDFNAAPKAAPEIAATDAGLGQNVVSDMNKANNPDLNSKNKVAADSGVWYQYNYRDAYPKKWNVDLLNGYTSPIYFDRIAPLDWRLKPKRSASAAIKAWLKGLTIAECMSSVVAMEYETIRAAVGDKKFDEHFGSATVDIPESQRLRINTNYHKTPLAQYMKSTDAALKNDGGTDNKRPAKAGEWYYFYNHPQYLLKHPGGAWQGENSIFMGVDAAGNQLWAGLGASNVTEKGMYQEMIDAYNGERDEDDYRALRSMFPSVDPKNHPEQLPPEYREGGGVFPSVISVSDVLTAPPYKIGDTTRKGGFVADAGRSLDKAKVEALKNSP